MDYAKVIIVGKVGRDPEMKYTPTGQAVTSFSVATNKTYTKDGQKQKKTTWFRVSCWGKLAENCNQYVKKGMEVLIEGELQPDVQGNPRVYESKGEHKSTFEVNASTVQFGTKTDGAKTEASAAAFPVDEEEVPF